MREPGSATVFFVLFCSFAVIVVMLSSDNLWMHSMTTTIRRRPIISSKTIPKGRIPDVLLAGAQKAGTSALSRYIRHQKNVCSPIVFLNKTYSMPKKEVHFMDHDEVFRLGLGAYQKYFEHCRDDSVAIDSTPKYLIYPERVRKIYEEQGTADQVKIMFVLREPVSRDISWYKHLAQKTKLNETTFNYVTRDKHSSQLLSFEEYLKANKVVPGWGSEFFRHRRRWTNDPGLYSKWLKKWFRLFDRQQILVLSYDEFKVNQTQFLDRIHQFLNLTQTSQVLEKVNVKMKIPPPPCSVQKKLVRYYEKWNTELYELLDDNPGPEMEQRPFPLFKTPCQ